MLTGRLGGFEGRVLVNGAAATQGRLRSLSVCVMQDDVLMRTISARECITFSARLRLPRSMPTAAKVARVEHLIAQLGLDKCADTAVQGLSGGERKRTAIGVELVTDPRLLFLDEPTSGLDSATALSVMQLISQLASGEGRTVVTTIHQPSSEIFALFHRLLLLADGRTAYDGPASDAVRYFSDLGYPCPLYSNPADYFIKVLLIAREWGRGGVWVVGGEGFGKTCGGDGRMCTCPHTRLRSPGRRTGPGPGETEKLGWRQHRL